MKLSEMSLDQARVAMIRLAEPFGHICDDEDMVKMLDELKNYWRLPVVVTVGKIIPKLVTLCFNKHYDDLMEVLSVLSETPSEKVKQMKFTEAVKVIRENYDDLASTFFPSSASATKPNAKG